MNHFTSLKFLIRIFSMLCMILVAVPNHSFGQLAAINWGAETPASNQVIKVIGQTQTGHYALTTRGKKKFYISYFDGPELKLMSSEEIQLPQMNGNASKPGDIFLMDGKLVLFTAVRDKQNEAWDFYGYTLDKSGRMQGAGKRVMHIPYKYNNLRGTFGFKLSEDQSKVLLWHSGVHPNDNRSWRLQMTLVQSDLSVIQEFSEDLGQRDLEEYSKVADVILKNDGGGYMAIQHSSFGLTRKFKFYQWDPSTKFKKRTTEVDLGPLDATTLKLGLDGQGNLIGAGFYSVYGDQEKLKIDGSYFIRIDKYLDEIIVQKKQKFGAKFASPLVHAQKIAKTEIAPNSFIPKAIIPRPDGGVLMFAESSSTFSIFLYLAFPATYRSGPIIAVSINPEGEIEWLNAIPKMQETRKNYWLPYGKLEDNSGVNFGAKFWKGRFHAPTVHQSFLIATEQDQTYLLYNDNLKNAEVSNPQDIHVLKNWKEAVPVVVKISPDGTMNKEYFDIVPKEVLVCPGPVYQVGMGELILYGSQANTGKFGRAQFGETVLVRE
ncbi:hypothetical protein [Pontibacter sp. G13]|uniref:hypothetical protein n=1 Tax=Pontibacter sp. G13 TaxID=3074898 RepID=UPI00288A29A9|nr:hypothetical protein [Pontibacter sp. G13]WNJ16990.1 hypothetical protein RJD25_19220 [Pontibacter sp. G13]